MIVRYRTFLSRDPTLEFIGLTMQDASKIWREGTRISDWVAQKRRELLEAAKEASAIARHCDEMSFHRNAESDLNDALATGALIAAGHSGMGRDRSLKRIPQDFWLVAEIRAGHDQAQSNGVWFENIKVLGGAAWVAKKPNSTEAPQTQAKVPDNPMPAPGGAKSFADERQAAILECFNRNPDFDGWIISKRLRYIKDVAQELFPGIDTRRGFGRSIILDTVKSLRKSGLLPSNNVQ